MGQEDLAIPSRIRLHVGRQVSAVVFAILYSVFWLTILLVFNHPTEELSVTLATLFVASFVVIKGGTFALGRAYQFLFRRLLDALSDTFEHKAIDNVDLSTLPPAPRSIKVVSFFAGTMLMILVWTLVQGCAAVAANVTLSTLEFSTLPSVVSIIAGWMFAIVAGGILLSFALIEVGIWVVEWRRTPQSYSRISLGRLLKLETANNISRWVVRP